MMDNFEAFVLKLANRQLVGALRRGLLYLTPLILIGSIVLALLNLPVPAYQNIIQAIFGERWRDIGLAIHKGTLQIMALTTLITVCYAFSQEKPFVKSGEINPVIIIITAFASYIAFTNNPDGIIGASEAGSTGMFGALIISGLACNLFCFFYKWRDYFWHTDLHNYNGSLLTLASFRAVVPALLTVTIFAAGGVLIKAIGLAGGGESMLVKVLSKLWNGQNYFSALGIILITHILWFLGIHGGNVVMDAMSGATPVAASSANAGIITKEFFDTYVYLGGCGATLGLLIALLLVGRNNNESRLAKASILPCIFNINEILVFGLPIIFNPYLFIPFVLSPVVLSFTSWVSLSLGWVPAPMQAVQWTTPIFMSAYLSTGSVAGIILQAVNLALAMLIYIPFIRLQQSHQQNIRISVFKSLGKQIKYVEEQQEKSILSRQDDTGFLARALMAEIKEGLAKNCVPLHLEYQPKVDSCGRVMGAEALLRWTHPVYGDVSPLIILGICDEADLTNDLGRWIMAQAFNALKYWHEQGLSNLSLSVNLSPRQLKKDASLVQAIYSYIDQTGIEPRYMELELTENTTIDSGGSSRSRLEEIKDLGVNISIDDFGMGHSSLLYIRDYYVNVVKIDASLVCGVVDDRQSRQIVSSILSLCDQLKVKAVAEGVETQEQLQVLNSLGCRYFQGFHFSRSLVNHQFLEYVRQHGMVDAAVNDQEPGIEKKRRAMYNKA